MHQIRFRLGLIHANIGVLRLMTNYRGKIILTLCTIKWLDLLAFFTVLDIGYLVNYRKWCILLLWIRIYVMELRFYHNTYHSYLNKLIILNNKILWILQNESYRTHVTEFYENYNTLSIQNSTIIEFCYWFINLLTITANYLLYLF